MNGETTLTIEDLAERVNNPVDFDASEVTDRIEQFTKQDLKTLIGATRFVRKLVDDLASLQKDMDNELVDRAEAVEMALASFIAHVNMVFLGPPGTAKSLVVRRLSYGLGMQHRPISVDELTREIDEILRQVQAERAGNENEGQAAGPRSQSPSDGDGRAERGRRYYEVLLTRYSTSDEILGPANLQLMIRRAMFYRQSTGLLPEADVAFLDEIWKANSAILNALLSISNERIFYNAGVPIRVPLCMIFGASNEVPREEELWAMYDRFPIRVICEPVDDAMSLLKKSAAHEVRSLFGGPENGNGAPSGVKQRATVNHFRLLYRAIHGYFGADSSLDGDGPFGRVFCDTFDALKREFQISDRSLYALYKVALALALLRGHDRPQATELDVFKYSFYEPETSPALEDAVNQRIYRYADVNKS